jgi:uncharacterized membrane protein
MHSTDAPLTISFRRAEIRALWLVSTVALAFILVAAAAALGSTVPSVWAAGALVVLVPGLVWSQWFEIGVRAWNKGVRLITGLLRAYTLGVCYYVLFTSVSLAGSSLGLGLGRRKISCWIPRAKREATLDKRTALDPRDGWSTELLALARRPGNRWMVCLLPVVLLLHLLREDRQESALPSSSTYTLY